MEARYHWGLLEAQNGEDRKAISRFEEAAGSHTASGQAALEMLHRLDLPRRPERYIKASLERDHKCIKVVIDNPSTVAVGDVAVLVRKSGKHHFRLNIPQTIPPGGRLNFQTDVPLAEKKDLRKWRVTIEQAALAP